MPPDLRKAHQILDKEVFRAHGKDTTSWPTESVIVADLMVLYQKMTTYYIVLMTILTGANPSTNNTLSQVAQGNGGAGCKRLIREPMPYTYLEVTVAHSR